MLTVSLPADLESRLRREAVRQGIGAAEYAGKLIAERLPHAAGAEEAAEDLALRGTAPIQLERKPLFSESLLLSTDDLPRWKPQVTLTRRVLAEAEDA